MLTVEIVKSEFAVCTSSSLASLQRGRNSYEKMLCRFFPTDRTLDGKLYSTASFIAFAKKSSRKKERKNDQKSIVVPLHQEKVSDGNNVKLSVRSPLEAENKSIIEYKTQDDQKYTENLIAPRNSVLMACTMTSGLLFASGLVIRQVSHFAYTEGWIGVDPCIGASFDLDPWKLELIIGLVLLVSTCRYMLLKLWPDFSESSDVANKQVLSSLEPLDYLLVAFLPGISEELLFRGALLPLLGLNWISALAAGVVFGALHLNGGRKYSFAIWATFVGFIYGMSTIVSSSILVPMAAHSLNNLVGGILWRSQNDEELK